MSNPIYRFFKATKSWLAFRGYAAAKNTRFRGTRGVDPIRSEELELQQYERDKVVSTCLAFRRDNPVVASISRLRKADVVGRGITPQPMTGNDDLNESISAAWKDFCQSPEITGMMTMRQLQQQMADSLLFFGDCGLIWTNLGKVQFVDGSRIGNPSGTYTSSEDDRNQNGVLVNEFGKPIAYNIGKRVHGVLTNIHEVPAYNFIMLLKRLRADQYRGVPELAPILNTLQDCDEYDRTEGIAAKVAASLSVFIADETPNQFADDGLEPAADQDDSGNLQSIDPGAYEYGKPGQKPYVISSNGRPNVDGIQWVQYLLRKCGSAVGIPLEFLMMEIGGSSFSASQGVILQYQQTIENYQADLIEALDLLYKRWLSYQVATGAVKMPEGADLFHVRWQPPLFRWVNKVAQVKADMEYFKMGILSLDDIASPFGHTAEDALRRKAQNIKKAREIATEEGVADVSLIESLPKQAQRD